MSILKSAITRRYSESFKVVAQTALDAEEIDSIEMITVEQGTYGPSLKILYKDFTWGYLDVDSQETAWELGDIVSPADIVVKTLYKESQGKTCYRVVHK